MNTCLKIVCFLLLTASFVPNALATDSCPSSIAGSCTSVSTQGSTCMDLLANSAPVDQFQTQCTSAGSTFSSSPCAATNLIGSCIMNSAGVDILVMRMYAPFPANLVSVMCTQSHGKICQ